MVIEHVVLFVAWMFYYFLHSLLATTQIKSRIGLSPRHYRIVYSLIATVLFIFLMLYTASIYSSLIYPPSATTNYAGLMLTTVGIFILKRSFRNYSLKEFIGLKKEEESALKTSGVQAKIRHPLYSGTLLIFIGYFIFNPQLSSLVLLLSVVVYLPFGIRLEEKKLIELFGDEYLAYKKRTPSLIPRLKPKSV